MEEDILNRLKENKELLEKIYKSTEKTRKYFMWTLIISAAVIILPLIGLMIILPQFINTMISSYKLPF